MKQLIPFEDIVGKTIAAVEDFDTAYVMVFTDETFCGCTADMGYEGDWTMCSAYKSDFDDPGTILKLAKLGVYTNEEIVALIEKWDADKKRTAAIKEHRERAQLANLKAKYESA